MAHIQIHFLVFSTLFLLSISSNHASLFPAIRHERPQDKVFSVPLHSLSSIPRSQEQPRSTSSLTISHLKSDLSRFEHINSRIKDAINPDCHDQKHRPHTPISPIDGGHLYSARVLVGKPARELYLLADTGSDISWLQCKPCVQCYNQTHPIFDPSKSPTYRPLSCGSNQCQALRSSANCSVHGDSKSRCQYAIAYGFFGFISSSGEYAVESLSFGGSDQVKNVAIGCGHENVGFQRFDGIMGLGWNEVSLPSLINAKSFSYCLVNGYSNSSSTLEFNSGMPKNSVVAPLLKSKNQNLSLFYYLELEEITVGKHRIRVPPSVYQLQSNGSGGMIIDSGTRFSFLASKAFIPLQDAFREYTKHLTAPKNMDPYSPLDTCYTISSRDLSGIHIPAMSFKFKGSSKRLWLRRENYFIPFSKSESESDEGVYCFAFVGSGDGETSIIGNVQQQGMRITFDLRNKFIGFSPKEC